MKLEHSFTVPAPIDRAWATLLDIEGVAPCMPGATLTGVDGDEFTGTVKIKLGPVALTYSGKGSFRERDDEARTVLIDATGRDRNGNGTAGAAVHARMEPVGPDATRVVVETDLKITGRPAQFGRGVMQDVGGKIIGQFADRLAAKMAEAPADGSGDRAAVPSDAEVPQEVASTTGALPVTTTGSATSGSATSGSATSGSATSGSATSGSATSGSATSGPPPGSPAAGSSAVAAPTGVPSLAGATAPTGGPRPAAPRPEPVRPLPNGAGGTSSAGAPTGTSAEEPAAELDLGAAVLPVLLRRFAPPVLIALVAAFVAWRLVRRRG